MYKKRQQQTGSVPNRDAVVTPFAAHHLRATAGEANVGTSAPPFYAFVDCAIFG